MNDAWRRATRSAPTRGIDITFPAEYGENPDFIEFVSGPNGLINIELKNIGHIENR